MKATERFSSLKGYVGLNLMRVKKINAMRARKDRLVYKSGDQVSIAAEKEKEGVKTGKAKKKKTVNRDRRREKRKFRDEASY